MLEKRVTAENYEERIRTLYPLAAAQIIQMFPAADDRAAEENFSRIYTAGAFGYGHHVWSDLAERTEPVWEKYGNGKVMELGERTEMIQDPEEVIYRISDDVQR